MFNSCRKLLIVGVYALINQTIGNLFRVNKTGSLLLCKGFQQGHILLN